MNKKNNARKCKICGGVTNPLFDSAFKITYDVCDRCNFTYKQPQHHISYDEEKSLYDTHENSLENKGYVAMFERFLAQGVTPFITQGKALDFGSGPGPVLYELLKQNGYDANHYDPFFHPDECALKTRYDLITSTEVFEHLSDVLSTVETLLSALKPGGYLAVMTSFRPEKNHDFLNWWYRRDPTHIAFHTLESMRYIEKQTSLNIIFHNQKNIITFEKRG